MNDFLDSEARAAVRSLRREGMDLVVSDIGSFEGLPVKVIRGRLRGVFPDLSFSGDLRIVLEDVRLRIEAGGLSGDCDEGISTLRRFCGVVGYREAPLDVVDVDPVVDLSGPLAMHVLSSC